MSFIDKLKDGKMVQVKLEKKYGEEIITTTAWVDVSERSKRIKVGDTITISTHPDPEGRWLVKEIFSEDQNIGRSDLHTDWPVGGL